DSERRRLSLSIKRVEGQVLPLRTEGLTDSGDLDDMPELGLSEDVFGEHTAPAPEGDVAEVVDATAAEDEAEADIVDAPVTEVEAAPAPEAEAEAPAAEAAPPEEE